MNAPSATQSRSATTAWTMPPWLWVWLGGYLLAGMPRQISSWHSLIVTYFVHGSTLSKVAGNGFVTVQRLTLIFDLLIYAVILAGVAAALLPHLRGRWVERRFKLASDDRPIMTEMQSFVSSHDPSISLRVTIRSDQMARIYPVGWRRARIAVFRPLAALWRRDREAAEAILLHEVAHRRQGDQLIVGLGSPFVMLMRIWAPAYLLLVFLPVAVYVTVGRGALAPLIVAFSLVQAVLIPAEVFLPVTALWLAELGADQVAAQAIGSDAVRQALRATAGSRASVAARALALLSHPPRRLRLRLAAARPAGAAGLMAVWPAALVVWVLVLPFGLTVLVLLGLGLPASLLESYLKLVSHELFAYAKPIVIATAIVLIGWPVLAYPWERLWSSAPRPRRRQPWWPYLAAASLPIGMLVLFLVPLPSSLPTEYPTAVPTALATSFPTSFPTALPTSLQPTGFCGRLTNWELGRGQAEAEHVDEDVTQVLVGSTSITAATAQRLDGEIRAALGDPPPGAARPSYTEAMTGYQTAVSDLEAGHSAAAGNALNNASNQLLKFDTLLEHLLSRCIPS